MSAPGNGRRDAPRPEDVASLAARAEGTQRSLAHTDARVANAQARCAAQQQRVNAAAAVVEDCIAFLAFAEASLAAEGR